jgi:pSer/pThr/pTyr-binding forkhead associated (FHA) protein
MAKLILSMDGLVLKEIPLIKERTTIGRKPHNDIQIDNLAISGDHAVIDTIVNDAFIEDLHSTNGTFVNGQPVKRHFLQDGDVIELGKYRLKYLSETEQQPGPQDYEKTMLLRPDTMRRTVEQAAARGFGDAPLTGKAQTATGVLSPLTSSRPAAGSQAPARAVVRVLSGGSAGRILELTKAVTTLGKPGVQVAAITRQADRYYVSHVEGGVLPTIAGRPMAVGQPRELRDGDIIELGGVRMEFLCQD